MLLCCLTWCIPFTDRSPSKVPPSTLPCTSHCVVPSDIIDRLPVEFRHLTKRHLQEPLTVLLDSGLVELDDAPAHYRCSELGRAIAPDGLTHPRQIDHPIEPVTTRAPSRTTSLTQPKLSKTLKATTEPKSRQKKASSVSSSATIASAQLEWNSSTVSTSELLPLSWFELVLCIDHRECSDDHTIPDMNRALLGALRQYKLPIHDQHVAVGMCESVVLPIGDFAVVLRLSSRMLNCSKDELRQRLLNLHPLPATVTIPENSAQLPLEAQRHLITLNMLIERKRHHQLQGDSDLHSSIFDGRYQHQRWMMSQTRISRCIWLFEGLLAVAGGSAPPPFLPPAKRGRGRPAVGSVSHDPIRDLLQSASRSLRFGLGHHIIPTRNWRDTVTVLVTLTLLIRRQLLQQHPNAVQVGSSWRQITLQHIDSSVIYRSPSLLQTFLVRCPPQYSILHLELLNRIARPTDSWTALCHQIDAWIKDAKQHRKRGLAVPPAPVSLSLEPVSLIFAKQLKQLVSADVASQLLMRFPSARKLREFLSSGGSISELRHGASQRRVGDAAQSKLITFFLS